MISMFPWNPREVIELNVQATVLHTFTFMHLADAFIQSDLQCIQAIHIFIY